MRLFVACALGEAEAAFFARVQRQLARETAVSRLTQPDQMHVTVRFIGEVTPRGARQLGGWFGSLTPLPQDALRCTQAGYGMFRSREGELVWAGLRCDPALVSFAGSLEAELREMGVPPETRPWRAHLTLARNAAFRSDPREAMGALPLLEEPFTLGQPALYLSEFVPGGVRYTPLAQVGLEL